MKCTKSLTFSPPSCKAPKPSHTNYMANDGQCVFPMLLSNVPDLDKIFQPLLGTYCPSSTKLNYVERKFCAIFDF